MILENLNLDDPVVLTDLEAEDVINKNVREQILASIGDGTKNDRMVNYMLKQSRASMERFIEVLQKRNQAHVAALFDGHVNKGKLIQGSSTTYRSANYDIVVPTTDYPTITSITIIPTRGNGTDSQKRHIFS